MKRGLKWFDSITVNINYFALTTRSQVLAPLIVPVLVQQFIGEESKGTAVGTMGLGALMAALLAQGLFGLLSDRTKHAWGRRRPYIFWGAITEVFVIVMIGICASSLSGMTGYLVLFILYILSMFTSNLGHAATQGLIPDLVPEEKHGIFSGIKALFELPFPVILVSFLIAPMVGAGNMWGALSVTGLIILVCMALTMLVPEVKYEQEVGPIDWKPFLNLFLMTGLFTIIILGMGALAKLILSVSEESAFLSIIIGVSAMSLTVVAGVWLSIRAGIGSGEAKKYPNFTWWVINRLAYMVSLTNLSTFMLYFFQEKFGYVAGEAAGPASRVMMIVGIFVLLLAIPTGWLSDHFGKKILLIISGIVSAIGVGVIVLFPGMIAVYIGALLIGAATGVFYSANWSLGTEIVPREQAGKFLGIQNLAGAGAVAVGAYLGGPIGDQMGYVVLFAIYAFIFLLSALSMAGIQHAGFSKKENA